MSTHTYDDTDTGARTEDIRREGELRVSFKSCTNSADGTGRRERREYVEQGKERRVDERHLVTNKLCSDDDDDDDQRFGTDALYFLPVSLTESSSTSAQQAI